MFKAKTSKPRTAIRVMAAAIFACLSIQIVQADYYGATPVINNEATRGLTTVTSAEPMGEGRLTFSVSGNWYNQNQEFISTPNKNASIVNGLGAASYGASPFIDLFASVGAFGSSNYNNTTKSTGWGSVKAGVQGTLPYPVKSMMHLGGQAALIGGTSDNQINTNRADGYNYFQTRTGTDFMAKLLQSISFGSASYPVKLHLNEGAVKSLSGDNASLLLLGAGLQGDISSFAAIGVELNSRTQMNNWAFRTDPLWITPSIQYQAFYNTNVSAGIDLSLSENRTNAGPRALEPYRLFGAVTFSLDLFAERRRALAIKKERAAQIEKENIALILEQEAAKKQANSLAKIASEDSISLIVLSQRLEEEKALRTEEEKTLLSTGLLTLDTVYFNIGKSAIGINAKPYLNLIAKMLVKYPLLQLEVSGHSDNSGSTESNITLAKARADAVRDYLVESEPALASRLTARGYGESMSKGSNKTMTGRQVNRRVEIVVVNKEILGQLQ
ncbi:MAG: hypothetical protein A2324_13825 [Candidatus Raymondbacteria bacterium RIFOXYB2_FULL_49_35]|nr:MAG: hypothetical protein A2324_13825 [Candidatus Raymondbacteria bacterium RIFOXYB2_FULL_49_35]